MEVSWWHSFLRSILSLAAKEQNNSVYLKKSINAAEPLNEDVFTKEGFLFLYSILNLAAKQQNNSVY